MIRDITAQETNNSYPLISVIVPIYNVEDYLSSCLDSLACQTYPNIEVLMVNDGSLDNCENICLNYSSHHTNFYYYKKENGGLSDARNYGIDRAKGQYIGFVDSDDYISKDMYMVMYQKITQFNAEIVAIDFAEVTSRDIEQTLEITPNSEIFDSKEAIRYLFSNEKYANYAWNKLYKANLFEHIRYPVKRKMEDLGTTYKLFGAANRIVYYPVRLYYYYQRADSILHVRGKDFYQDKLFLAQERYLDLVNMYPDMVENYTFYLNTALECLPYISNDSKMYDLTISYLKRISSHYCRQLSSTRRIKYYMVKYLPWLYKRLFGGAYGD